MTDTSKNQRRNSGDDRIFLTDGGLETAMIFLEGLDLPMFASFTLLESGEGCAAMTRYFDRFLSVAETQNTGFVLDTATWRAGVHWGEALGRSSDEMLAANRAAVDFAKVTRETWRDRVSPIRINGVVGPAGDGYCIEEELDPVAATARHRPQIQALVDAGVDLISAVTMTHVGEATGVARVAAEVGCPAVISFTVETDGRLPTGQSIGAAIDEVDAATGGAPLYYMINCAHPDHFREALDRDAAWLKRIGGIRANASRMSHAELDAAEELDDGDPKEFGRLHAELLSILPNIRVLGGCCGTDHRHVGCIAHHIPARVAA